MRRRLDWLLRDPRGRLTRLRLRLTVTPLRTALAKRQMLNRSELSPKAKELLRKTDSRVHPYEDMFIDGSFPYFWAGLEAIRNIVAALELAGTEPPAAILDMPCGFGRVMRSLAARFPEASMTACDIRPRAVRFCARRFGAEGVISYPILAFEEMSFAQPFDLIWCGSLVTHIDAPRTLALLDLFARSARPGALIVFTTLGTSVADEIQAGKDYMLTPPDVSRVLASYEQSGYGYANWSWESDYHS
jgi:2-polyprenyl-3-methyl-5-hydroxy-6-metoxy-1,4-benzoquinol methylase